MKKILVIAPYAYLPSMSGGQKFIAEFLRYLGKYTELHVVSVSGNQLTPDDHYTLVPLLKKSFSRYYDTSLVKKISSLVQEKGFDAVIWEHPYFSWLAYRVRKRTGVRTLIHTHNIEHQRFRSTGRWWWPLLRVYEKRCFKKADGLFFITPEDRQFAIEKWKIPASRCFDLPFGTGLQEYPADRASSRMQVAGKHGIGPGERIYLFTGALGYKPNLDALQDILERINPLLLEGSPYKLIICGKGLPDSLKGLEAYGPQRVIYAGFVEDINQYYKAADILLNPVLSGGGIKTKMVEAIACGASVVAFNTGAAGVDPSICGGKLVMVPDRDWTAFARAVLDTPKEGSVVPPAFYAKFNWDSVIQRILESAI